MPLPLFTGEASLYRMRQPYRGYSSSGVSTGSITAAWGLPCGTCPGPCTQDDTSPTGCSQTCWTHAPPHGTCDDYDRPCHGCQIGCAAGETQCGNFCVNLLNDSAHCGTCTNACAANETCQNGQCVCAPSSSCGATCCAPGTVCCGGTCGSPCPDGIHCCTSGTCTADSTECCIGHLCPDGKTCCRDACISLPFVGQVCI